MHVNEGGNEATHKVNTTKRQPINVIQIISCAIDYDNKKTIAHGLSRSLALYRFVVFSSSLDSLIFVYAVIRMWEQSISLTLYRTKQQLLLIV